MDDLKRQRGERLRLLKGKLTDKQFAQLFGIHWTTMRKYITGENSPRDESVWKNIASYYDIPLKWLLYGCLPDSKEFSISQLRYIFEQDPVVIDIVEKNGVIFPVVPAYVSKTQVGSFCIHCNRYHWHGKDMDGMFPEYSGVEKDGYRTSHCTTVNSPYKKNGYILNIIGNIDGLNSFENEYESICKNCKKTYSTAFGACSCGFVNENTVDCRYEKLSDAYRKIYLIDSSDRIVHDESVSSPSPRKSEGGETGERFVLNSLSAKTPSMMYTSGHGHAIDLYKYLNGLSVTEQNDTINIVMQYVPGFAEYMLRKTK